MNLQMMKKKQKSQCEAENNHKVVISEPKNFSFVIASLGLI